MKTTSILSATCALLLTLVGGCDEGESGSSDDGETTSSDADGDGTMDASTDDSGTTQGDGDGDATGDGDGDSTGDGDGDGDTGTDATGGETGGGAHAGSCDFQPDEPQCWHAVNEFDEPAQIEQACTDGNGTYSAGDCPSAGLVAICDQTPFKIFHYYEGVDLGLTEITCGQIGGVWMPQ